MPTPNSLRKVAAENGGHKATHVQAKSGLPARPKQVTDSAGLQVEELDSEAISPLTAAKPRRFEPKELDESKANRALPLVIQAESDRPPTTSAFLLEENGPATISDRTALAPGWDERPTSKAGWADENKPTSKERPTSSGRPTSKDLDRKMVWARDTEELKSQVRERLATERPYDVKDLYHETGLFQWIARHHIFENTTLAVITINAIYIGFETDFNESDVLLEANPFFIVGENFFCVYYLFEWIVRFMSFRSKYQCLFDAWFMFDSGLVLLIVLETWVFVILAGGRSPFGNNAAILRLFRLLRLSRLVKMLRSSPQLMILIKGVVTAMHSVVYVMLLLGILTYVFAIICTILSSDAGVIKDQYFDGVALSMYSLIIYATLLDDLSDFMDAIRAENSMILFVVFIFICLSALTVMNMLVGILCEVISSVAETEKELFLAEKCRSVMKEIVVNLDQDYSGSISLKEMKDILVTPGAINALQEIGVDPLGMIDFAEMFFWDEAGKPVDLSFERFMELVLDLRSSNNATLKDIMNLGKQFNAKLNHQAEATRNLEVQLRKSTTRLESQIQDVLRGVQNLTTKIESKALH